jgi:hypothetical protein
MSLRRYGAQTSCWSRLVRTFASRKKQQRHDRLQTP